jgi:small subunit ribosomal protein S8
MIATDPIADMLTRIRNAQKARLTSVDIPVSKIKKQIADLLEKEGFVSGCKVMPGKPWGTLRVALKYQPNGEPMIREVHRVSKPGCRVYASVDELEKMTGVIHMNVVTTSKGIMTSREAIEAKLGGEVMFKLM